MKVLSRDFTVREKILMLVLVLLLIVFAYYKLVDEPVRTQTARAQRNITALQDEMSLAQVKLRVMQSRESLLETIQKSENSTYMESYNAGSAERAFLNDLLADALEYSITFQDAVKRGKQIRRTFMLRYQAENYDMAQQILDQLYNYEHRLLIEDVQFSQSDNDNDLKTGTVIVNLTATFYETISGGEEDAGLQVIDEPDPEG